MKTLKKVLIGLASGAALMLGVSTSQAQMDDVEIKIEHLTGGLYVIYGQGGNIGMSAGEEGVFLVDDQFAPLTEKLMAAIREVNDGEVHFLINTHHHGDHTGGNENFGKKGTVILSHDNVRKRLVAGDGPDDGLPVITFNDKASIHLNGSEARAVHFEHAHTDGDSIIVFKAQNLIHTGDIFFRGRFPFIDVNSGGSINGMIGAVEAIITLADDDTIIIPGHGEVGGLADIKEYLVMLTTIRDRVKTLKDAGASLEEVLAANPTKGHDDLTWDFVNPERMVTAVYTSLPD